MAICHFSEVRFLLDGKKMSKTKSKCVDVIDVVGNKVFVMSMDRSQEGFAILLSDVDDDGKVTILMLSEAAKSRYRKGQVLK